MKNAVFPFPGCLGCHSNFAWLITSSDVCKIRVCMGFLCVCVEIGMISSLLIVRVSNHFSLSFLLRTGQPGLRNRSLIGHTLFSHVIRICLRTERWRNVDTRQGFIRDPRIIERNPGKAMKGTRIFRLAAAPIRCRGKRHLVNLHQNAHAKECIDFKIKRKTKIFSWDGR